jgi:putative phage-type endonuclease
MVLQKKAITMKYILKTEADWLEIRKKYITASQAAILVGADPYSSPSKITKPDPFSGNSFTAVGQMLEPIVVNITNQVLKTTFKLYEQEANVKEFYTKGYLGATPDAYMNMSNGLIELLECKTTRPKTYLKYSSVPPEKYLIQLMVQMMCTGAESGYLSILCTDLTQHTTVLKWPVAVYRVWKNSEICTILELETERFKQCEQKGTLYRVNSKVKQKIKLLLPLCYRKIND